MKECPVTGRKSEGLTSHRTPNVLSPRTNKKRATPAPGGNYTLSSSNFELQQQRESPNRPTKPLKLKGGGKNVAENKNAKHQEQENAAPKNYLARLRMYYGGLVKRKPGNK